VGVDVEDLQRRPVDRGFISRYCSPAEAADIFAQPDATWHDRFLTYWTLKESYLKARGLGVSVSLSSVSFSLSGTEPAISFSGPLADWDARWQFHLMHLTNRHLLAAALPMGSDGRSTLVTAPYDFSWLDAW
jgi:4'-phosphopantetheinyl transferase